MRRRPKSQDCARSFPGDRAPLPATMDRREDSRWVQGGRRPGQSLAYVYSRENVADAGIAGVLTEDEARRIASNIAKLPALLGAAGNPEFDLPKEAVSRRRLRRAPFLGHYSMSYCGPADL